MDALVKILMLVFVYTYAVYGAIEISHSSCMNKSATCITCKLSDSDNNITGIEVSKTLLKCLYLEDVLVTTKVLFKYLYLQFDTSPDVDFLKIPTAPREHFMDWSVHLDYIHVTKSPINITMDSLLVFCGISSVRKVVITDKCSINGTIINTFFSGLDYLLALEFGNNIIYDGRVLPNGEMNTSIIPIPYNFIYDLKKLTFLKLENTNQIIPQEFFKNSFELVHLILCGNFMPKNVTKMFENLNNLEYFRITEMNITELNEDLISCLKNLIYLEISRNKITHLPEKLFEEFLNIEDIDISSNNLITLPENIFKNNKKLKSISLFNNNIHHTEYNFLRYNTELDVINLSANQEINSSPMLLFSTISNLTNLSLSNCSLSVIRGDIFEKLDNLKYINMSNNLLQEIPEFISNQSLLHELDLSNNRLTKVSKEVFANHYYLTLLNLNNNNITTIGNELDKLVNLKYLYMKGNQLQMIDLNALWVQDEIKEIDFSYNDLTYDIITPWLTRYYENLEVLRLSHNKLDTFFGYQPKPFTAAKKYYKTMLRETYYPNLKILDLSYNQIGSIDESDFDVILKYSHNCQINLEHNEIQTFIIAEKHIHTEKLNNRGIQLNLNHNPLICDCQLTLLYMFYDHRLNPYLYSEIHIIADQLYCTSPPTLSGTRIIKLNSSSIWCPYKWFQNQYPTLIPHNFCPKQAKCYFKSGSFEINFSKHQNWTKPPKLDSRVQFNVSVTINLAENKIEEMPSKQIGYEKIKGLNMSFNLLNRIQWLPENITEIYLHNNSFTALTDDEIDILSNPGIERISLYNNPWTCNCEAINFQKFLINTLSKIINPEGIRCKDTNMQLIQIENLCPPRTGLIISLSVSVALIGLIFGVLIALYYRYNTDIKVWLYAHQYCLWLVTEKELDKDKIYDAFISYSHQDEELVIPELLANLEEGPVLYKLCLHYRNWIPGEFISKNIANSIAESRRTIIILSENFIKSEWGKMEFRVAHKQALEENRARVIIIVLGKIDFDNLDEELKSYIKTNTYLKWGEPWFWNKLRYALPRYRRKVMIINEHEEEVQSTNMNLMGNELISMSQNQDLEPGTLNNEELIELRENI